MKQKSLFITIEGIEGAGKSTHAKYLVDYLRSLEFNVVHTREPGGTIIAEKIRNILLDKKNFEPITDQAEILLLFAARSQHLTHVIIPALNEGKLVVCERFTDATVAYQGGGRGVELNNIRFLENFVQKDLRPNLVLLFDVEVKLGLDRIKSRGITDRIEQEKIDFFYKVKEMYLYMAKQTPEKYFVIDANKDLLLVQQQIKEKINIFLYANQLLK